MKYKKIELIKDDVVDDGSVVRIKESDIAKPVYDVTVRMESDHYLKIRDGGDLDRLGIYLPSAYDWQIVKDNNGILVLVATKKKQGE